MTTARADCIEDYIATRYQGGLIGVSDLAEYCQMSEGMVFKVLVQLQQQGIVKIIKRYSCPEGHQISPEELPHCSECDYPYSEDMITTLILVKPLEVQNRVYSIK